jgi:hypothetical protein
MTSLLLIWVGLLVALVFFAVGKPREGGALTLAYFLGLSLIHVPGLLIFLDPLAPVGGRDATMVGADMTLIGMTAFVVGAIVARQLRGRAGRVGSSTAAEVEAFTGLGWRAFGLGFFAYFVLLPIANRLPSASSIVAALATVMIVGLWLRLYGAEVTRDFRRTASTLAILPLLPLATLAGGGFLGFGIYWVLSVVTFLFVIARRRFWFFALAPVVMVLGLSLFVTYMGQRTGIRDTVWREHATLSDRLQRISTLVTDFHVLDLHDPTQLDALNDRLNQNFLVGTGVLRHETGAVALEHGATVSPLALIPRVLWPDKPQVGGGGDVVSQFTGIQFAAGTSVGAGSVLEFYMNFGVPGLVIGFAALGFLLMRLDHGVMRGLATGDLRMLLSNAMPGLAMLAPGGNFLEIIVSVAAAYVTAQMLSRFSYFAAGPTMIARPAIAPARAPVA